MKTTVLNHPRILLYVSIAFVVVLLPVACLAGTISGNITDDAGNPLENVSVQAYSAQCHDGNLGQSTSNASGNYSIAGIPDGTQAYVYADSAPTGQKLTQEWYYNGGEGIQDCWLAQQVDDDASGVNFVLERSGSITGTVIDASGDPISNMHVYATIYDVDCNGYWLSDANTDSDGVYQLDHLPPGEVVLRTCSECSGLDYVNEYYDDVRDCSSADPINISAGNTFAGKDFQLEQGGTIYGYVKTAVGSTPIENASVDIYTGKCYNGHLRGTQTDASGRFEFTGLPLGSQYILRADASGSGQNFISQWYDNVADTENCDDASWVDIGADDVIFEMVEGGAVSGTIRNSDTNQLLTGLSVDVSIIQGDPCGPHQYVMGRYSNPIDGSFIIDGIPHGDYYLRTYPGDSNFISEWWNASGSSINCADAQPISISSGVTITDREFQLEEGGAVSGHVYDDFGQPLANVHVFAQEASCDGQWLAGTNTDDQGFYRIQGVLPVSVFIRTEAANNGYNVIDEFSGGTPDCNAATEIIVAVGEETQNTNFNLSPGGTISGYVYQQNGFTPIAGANVNIYTGLCHNGHLRGVQTDDNGYFEFIGLPSGGQFILRADANGDGQNYISQWYDNVKDYEDCNAATFVPVGEMVAFNLEEGASISGHVTDESGSPIEDVHVYATDADTGNWLGGTNTDDSGAFHLAGLPSVGCRVYICPTCSDLPYVDEIYNDTYDHNAAAVISLTTGSDIILAEEIRLAAANTISGIISGLHSDQNVYISATDDGGTQDQQDDINLGRGYTADASGNAAYTLNVLPGHFYRVQIYPDGDPSAYYLQGNPNGTYAHGLATLVDPTTNPNNIDIQVTQGVQLSGTINGLGIDQHVWINAHCENGTPNDDTDDFSFGMEIWGDGTGADTFSMAVPAGFTYRFCFGQDNGITACYDGTSDGTFGGIDPNVVVNDDLILDPLVVTPAVMINGIVDNLGPDQFVRIHAHSNANTPDGADDFATSRDFNADAGGVLNYSLPVPINYPYIVEFQPENIPGAFYVEGDINGTRDWSLATEFLADADVNGVNLTIAATGSIAGNVSSEGQPLAGIGVHVFADMCGNNGWQNHLGSAQTDANGDYQIDGLPLSDVYVLACPGCDNRNYFDRWYDGDSGIEDCNQALEVSVFDGGLTSGIDFDLSRGPHYLNWWDVAVYHGSLGIGFDLLPGFDPFLESALIEGPNGFTYAFDLQSDVLEWLNECSYLVSWNHDFTGPINYGDYTLTLTFKNGVVKTYTHELLQVAVTPVNSTSMSHTVNPDGSIDFAWTNPDPNQRYQVRIYQGGERLYRSGMLNTESLQVSADSLKCLVLGESYTWQMRAYDDNDPYYTCEKSNSLPLIYDPGELENRAKWFEATNYLGTSSLAVNKLSLYFDTRPGSRENMTSATVTGPAGFAPYEVDLVNDWYDISTETRKNSGWSQFLPAPVLDGQYTLTVTFDDGYPEVHTYNLSAATLTAVDVVTMNHEIYENGAMGFYWNIPPGVTGQQYNVRIRSMDGSHEFAKSATYTDNTEMYLSSWDLRALTHGQTFQWFVQASDADNDTWIRSDSSYFVYDPFQIYSVADIDKDWDVDGSDLAALVQRIQNGSVVDVAGALSEFAPRYGQLQ